MRKIKSVERPASRVESFFFVNFEFFCGNTKPGEGRASTNAKSGENEIAREQKIGAK
jgi:hypothetical protein